VVAYGRQRERDLLKAQASTIKCQLRCGTTDKFVVACVDFFVSVFVGGTQKEQGLLCCGLSHGDDDALNATARVSADNTEPRPVSIDVCLNLFLSNVHPAVLGHPVRLDARA
jgi:hypothetical protein